MDVPEPFKLCNLHISCGSVVSFWYRQYVLSHRAPDLRDDGLEISFHLMASLKTLRLTQPTQFEIHLIHMSGFITAHRNMNSRHNQWRKPNPSIHRNYIEGNKYQNTQIPTNCNRKAENLLHVGNIIRPDYRCIDTFRNKLIKDSIMINIQAQRNSGTNTAQNNPHKNITSICANTQHVFNLEPAFENPSDTSFEISPTTRDSQLKTSAQV